MQPSSQWRKLIYDILSDAACMGKEGSEVMLGECRLEDEPKA
jgi:hypothetical protein